jgi:hypothetical protein
MQVNMAAACDAGVALGSESGPRRQKTLRLYPVKLIAGSLL